MGFGLVARCSDRGGRILEPGGMENPWQVCLSRGGNIQACEAQELSLRRHVHWLITGPGTGEI